MFTSLAEKLDSVIRRLKGYSLLTPSNIKEALQEVRVALLEADVNYKVVKDFIAEVESQVIGQKTIKGVLPGQQLVKIVFDQITELLGAKSYPPKFSSGTSVWLLTGLQGSGKTTLCGKLAKFYTSKGKKVLLVAADVYRPAAVDQLKIVGEGIKVPVFFINETPLSICQKAFQYAQKEGIDLVLIDTAGRLHIDHELMQELIEIKQKINPDEIFLVADAMTGQDAVKVATTFNQTLGITAIILTKLDGDARGGAALSIKKVTGCPIKYVSTGEKIEALELFYPERMASRILGMGDVVTLVEKAQEALDWQEALKLEKKLKKEEFSLQDFSNQLQALKKMGPLESVIRLIPGLPAGALKNLNADEKSLTKIEAMINSMTLEERRQPQLIDGSRRQRIAKGSGNSIQDVNRFLKQFFQMRALLKKFSKMDLKTLNKGFFSFSKSSN